MGFFGITKTDPAAGQRSLERQAMWEQALAQNRLPGFVAERLKGAASGTMPWMATMTPAELLVMKSHGIRPVATVTGTCALHYGFSWTRGHAEGWRTAAARLTEEATLCGANAVIDVKMRTAHLGAGSTMDYTLVGTAIRVEGLPPSADPIIATVSAIEFVRLLEAGIVPVGIAVGAAYRWLNDTYGTTGYLSQIFSDNMQFQQGRNFAQDDVWDMQAPNTSVISQFWESVRREAHRDLFNDGRTQGNGVLADIHFGQLLKREGDQNTPPAYLGRHIVIGTVIDTQDRHPVPHEIRTVVDMRDNADLLGAQARNIYPTANEEGAI